MLELLAITFPKHQVPHHPAPAVGQVLLQLHPIAEVFPIHCQEAVGQTQSMSGLRIRGGMFHQVQVTQLHII